MQPQLFSFGSVAIPSFAFFSGVGILLAMAAGLALARKEGLDPVELLAYWLFLLAAFWIGAVVYKLVFTFVEDPGGFFRAGATLKMLIRESGTSIVGAITGGILFSLIYLKKVGLPLWTTLDISFTGIPLAQVFGRLGCFMGGCCYGRPTDLPWGVTFPGHARAVHPTQLYEAALNLLNFFVLLTLHKRKKREGRIFALYLVNYALIRFFVEYWRGDDYRGFVWRGETPWSSLSIPQLMSLLGLAAGIVLLCLRKAGTQPR